ncbi:ABC transporter permease subunit [Streptomyces sp. JNUCC 64]
MSGTTGPGHPAPDAPVSTVDASTTPTPPVPAAPGPRWPPTAAPRLRGLRLNLRHRRRVGEPGALPVLAGLALVAVVFQSLNPAFLSAENLSHIAVDTAGPGLIALGVVLVLLLGEIDLSVGSVSGLAGAVLAVLNVTHGVPEALALVLAVLAGTTAGLVHGVLFARIGVPAFVVTMAGLLVWNGLMLQLLGADGTVNLDDTGPTAQLTRHHFTDVSAAYGLATAVVAGHLLTRTLDARRRRAAGLPRPSAGRTLAGTAALAAPCYGAAYVLNQYLGLPLALVLLLGVTALTDLVLRRTVPGRRVLAVGGGTEAARRAGADVAAVRTAVFAAAGALAALGGLLIASRIAAANQGAGSGDLLMSCVAAAVIGGTSLFGGRGRAWSAPLGALVLVSVQKGLQMESLAEPVKYMITGTVLLAAVVTDSVARRGRGGAGRG